LLCHSKGGLDARDWLGRLKADYEAQPANKTVPALVVGQFMTLNTPHKGSVIADYSLIAYQCSYWDYDNTFTGYIRDEAEPVHYDVATMMDWVRIGRWIGVTPDTDATWDLRTTAMDTLNRTNMGQLAGYVNPDKTRPTFLASASDAIVTFNYAGQVTLDPTHAQIANRWEDTTVTGFAAMMSEYFYTTLRLVESATRPDNPEPDGRRHLYQNEYPSEMGSVENDFLVAYPSGYPCTVANNVFGLHYRYRGRGEGKMHANIADDFVALKLKGLNHVKDFK
jgi:hypothetical protein